MRLLRRLAYAGLALAFSRVVLGAVARATGAAPAARATGLDDAGAGEMALRSTVGPALATAERTLAAGGAAALLALLGVALLRRRDAGIGGRGGVLRAALPAVALGVAVVALPLVAGLPAAAATVLQLALVGAIAVTVVRAGGLGAATSYGTTNADDQPDRVRVAPLAPRGRSAVVSGVAAALAALSVIVGPPASAGALAASLLLVVAVAAALGVLAPRDGWYAAEAGRAARIALGTLLLQLVAGATLAALALPGAVRTMHVALGALVWLALVVTATLVRRAPATRAVAPLEASAAIVAWPPSEAVDDVAAATTAEPASDMAETVEIADTAPHFPAFPLAASARSAADVVADTAEPVPTEASSPTEIASAEIESDEIAYDGELGEPIESAAVASDVAEVADAATSTARTADAPPAYGAPEELPVAAAVVDASSLDVEAADDEPPVAATVADAAGDVATEPQPVEAAPGVGEEAAVAEVVASAAVPVERLTEFAPVDVAPVYIAPVEETPAETHLADAAVEEEREPPPPAATVVVEEAEAAPRDAAVAEVAAPEPASDALADDIYDAADVVADVAPLETTDFEIAGSALEASDVAIDATHAPAVVEDAAQEREVAAFSAPVADSPRAPDVEHAPSTEAEPVAEVVADVDAGIATVAADIDEGAVSERAEEEEIFPGAAESMDVPDYEPASQRAALDDAFDADDVDVDDLVLDGPLPSSVFERELERGVDRGADRGIEDEIERALQRDERDWSARDDSTRDAPEPAAVSPADAVVGAPLDVATTARAEDAPAEGALAEHVLLEEAPASEEAAAITPLPRRPRRPPTLAVLLARGADF